MFISINSVEFLEYKRKYGERLALTWLSIYQERFRQKQAKELNKAFGIDFSSEIGKAIPIKKLSLPNTKDFEPSSEYIKEYSKNLKETYRKYCTKEYLNEEEERIDMYEKKY